MKLIVSGLLIFVSFSSFALEYSQDFYLDAEIFSQKDGVKFAVNSTEKNADFFCVSKGFDSSIEHNAGSASTSKLAVKNILPNGEPRDLGVFDKESSQPLVRVKCKLDVKK